MNHLQMRDWVLNRLSLYLPNRIEGRIIKSLTDDSESLGGILLQTVVVICMDLQANTAFEERNRTKEVESLDQMDERKIRSALIDSQGDLYKTCNILGIGKTTLYRKAKQFGISLK